MIYVHIVSEIMGPRIAGVYRKRKDAAVRLEELGGPAGHWMILRFPVKGS